MSEHIWCQENIAAYVAGGLDVTEGERLEEHLSDCGDCARGVEEARALDRKLAPLFRAANPGPALEDRLIRALPSRQARRFSLSLSLSRRAKACLAVAAVFLLMALGAAITEFSEPKVGKGKNLPANRQVVYRSGDNEGVVKQNKEKPDPFLTTDVDPAAQDVDTEIKYRMNRQGIVGLGTGTMAKSKEREGKDVGKSPDELAMDMREDTLKGLNSDVKNGDFKPKPPVYSGPCSDREVRAVTPA